MARCIIALTLCFALAFPFVPCRRISNDNKAASLHVTRLPQDSIDHSHTRSSIFVRGFEFSTSEAALARHFGVVGAIKDLRLQSRNAAVITYEEPSAASRAVKELDKTTLGDQSRYMDVKLDDPDSQLRNSHKARGKDKDKAKTEDAANRGSRPSGRSIFVNGFEPNTGDDALTSYFGTVGAIEHHHFQSKVSAVITYAKESAAQEAVAKLDRSYMKNGDKRYVSVKLDNSL